MTLSSDTSEWLTIGTQYRIKDTGEVWEIVALDRGLSEYKVCCRYSRPGQGFYLKIGTLSTVYCSYIHRSLVVGSRILMAVPLLVSSGNLTFTSDPLDLAAVEPEFRLWAVTLQGLSEEEDEYCLHHFRCVQRPTDEMLERWYERNYKDKLAHFSVKQVNLKAEILDGPLEESEDSGVITTDNVDALRYATDYWGKPVQFPIPCAQAVRDRPATPAAKCSCDTTSLFLNGCQCGGS